MNNDKLSKYIEANFIANDIICKFCDIFDWLVAEKYLSIECEEELTEKIKKISYLSKKREQLVL
jgi:hypothetical protein